MKAKNVVAILILLVLLTSCMTTEKPVDRSYLIEAYVPKSSIKKTEQLVLDTTVPSDSPTGQTVTEAVPEGTVVKVLDEPILTDDEIAEKMAALEWNVESEPIGSVDIQVIGTAPVREEPAVETVNEEPALSESPEDVAEAIEVFVDNGEPAAGPEDNIDPSMKGEQWTDMSADLSRTISEQAEPVGQAVFDELQPPETLPEQKSVPEELPADNAGTVTEDEVFPADTERNASLGKENAPVQDEGDPSASAEPEEADKPEPAVMDDVILSEPAETEPAGTQQTYDSLPVDEPTAKPTANGLRRTVSDIKSWCEDHIALLFICFCMLMLLLIVILLIAGGRKNPDGRKRSKATNAAKAAKLPAAETPKKKQPKFKYKAGSWNVVQKSWPED